MAAEEKTVSVILLQEYRIGYSAIFIVTATRPKVLLLIIAIGVSIHILRSRMLTKKTIEELKQKPLFFILRQS